MHTNMRKVRWVASLAAIAAASTVASSSYAFDQRLSYSACLGDLGSNDSYQGGGNNLTANTLVLGCPVLDTASLPHASMTSIHLYYDDLNTTQSVQAARCVAFQNVAGGACGDLVASSAAGTGTSFLAVPNTPASFAANWNFGHFAHVMVFLPPKQGASVSKVKGYWMSN